MVHFVLDKLVEFIVFLALYFLVDFILEVEMMGVLSTMGVLLADFVSLRIGRRSSVANLPVEDRLGHLRHVFILTIFIGILINMIVNS